jgi:hypothetical protein
MAGPHSPFNTPGERRHRVGLGSVIYVHSGAATTPGNLTMDANQILQGQGTVYTLNGMTIAAGARPTLSGTVTLANVTSVTCGQFHRSSGLSASGTTQPIIIDQVNVTGGSNALSLTNVSGLVTVNNANFTNSTGAKC